MIVANYGPNYLDFAAAERLSLQHENDSIAACVVGRCHSTVPIQAVAAAGFAGDSDARQTAA